MAEQQDRNEQSGGDKNSLGVSQKTAVAIGERLRGRREELGRDLREIATRIRIRTSYLEAMESGQWDVLPQGVNGRGLIRVYARDLGMDIAELDPRPPQERASSEVRVAVRTLSRDDARAEGLERKRTTPGQQRPGGWQRLRDRQQGSTPSVSGPARRSSGADTLDAIDARSAGLEDLLGLTDSGPELPKTDLPETLQTSPSNPEDVPEVDTDTVMKDILGRQNPPSPTPVAVSEPAAQELVAPAPVAQEATVQAPENHATGEEPVSVPVAENHEPPRSFHESIVESVAEVAVPEAREAERLPEETREERHELPVTDAQETVTEPARAVVEREEPAPRTQERAAPATPRRGLWIAAGVVACAVLAAVAAMWPDSEPAAPVQVAATPTAPEPTSVAAETSAATTEFPGSESAGDPVDGVKENLEASAGTTEAVAVASPTPVETLVEPTPVVAAEATMTPEPTPVTAVAGQRVAILTISGKVELRIKADGKEVYGGFHEGGRLEVPFSKFADIFVSDGSKVELNYEGWPSYGKLGWEGRRRRLILNAEGYSGIGRGMF